MKLKNILFSLVFMMSAQLIQAQDVPQTQLSILTKITADWCTNCGTWGWNLMEDMLEDNAANIIVLNSHASGGLYDAAAADIKANFGANGQPKFYINNTDLLANSGNGAAKRMEAMQLIEANAGQTPLANAGVLFTREGTTFTINTKTKFFSEMNGSVHLSLLVLENNVSFNQSPIGTQDHPSVVRRAESGSTFGDAIAQGTIAAGTEIDGNYTIEGEATWNMDNIKIAALLWTEENGNYTYVNGTQASESAVSSLNGIEAAFQLEWRNAGSQHQLFLSNDSPLGDSNISLINTQGQLVRSILTGNIAAGEQLVPFSSEGLSAGNYFVRVDTEKGTKTISIQL